MSIESRLHEATDVLTHIMGLLADLNEVAVELLEIVSGKREGMISVADEAEGQNGKETSEVNELREEISGTITRLFRTSILIRQAAHTDTFAKALSRNRYHFNEQFDIAHVGEKYPQLATNDYVWLRQRLGRAITHRRHYLNYIQDHREKLGDTLNHGDKADSSIAGSRPSFFTKATTFAVERITPQLLVVEESDPEDDTRSCTTISRSIDGSPELSTTLRIPKLNDLRVGNKNDFECPFCFQIKMFNSERTWRRHVFADLRPYVCTFPDCDAPYFGDINKWFQHEMTLHRVAYKCFLCPNKTYHSETKYLSHLKRVHENMLGDGGGQQSKDLARKPLAQIPASDCPCCSDWVDRLQKQTTQTSRPESNEILAVTPTVFKRHLAGHLEQLALFAIPVSAATDEDDDSNAAREEVMSKRTDISQLSTLSFASFQGDSEDALPETEVDPSQSEAPHTDVQVTEIKAETDNELTSPVSPPLSGPSVDPLSPADMKAPTVDPEVNRGEELTEPPVSEHSTPSSWIWSADYQDYYYVTYDAYNRPVYYWAKHMRNNIEAPQSVHVRSDASHAQLGTGSVPEAVRALKDFISGTPEQGPYDQLDSSYFMRMGSSAASFFVVGRVFAMLYVEKASATSEHDLNDDAHTVVRFGGVAYSTIRRFVVVEVKWGFVKACEIGTYSGRGVLKPGCVPKEHAIVHLTGTNPADCYIPGEYESGMDKEPIQVDPANPEVTLSYDTRIRFSKTYPIEMNVKVKDVGRINPPYLGLLLQYWNEER
ncbi:hypothetical protein NX059_007084 [Plenodomus lindquistii]|nr:hypothetical protein NX059_007084 [Plenodomus lindquistii]